MYGPHGPNPAAVGQETIMETIIAILMDNSHYGFGFGLVFGYLALRRAVQCTNIMATSKASRIITRIADAA